MNLTTYSYRLVCAVRGDKLELPSPHNWGYRRNSPADVVWCRNKTTVHFYYNIFNDFMCELLTELQLNISISVINNVERRHIKQRTLSEKCVHCLSVFWHPESHLYCQSFNTRNYALQFYVTFLVPYHLVIVMFSFSSTSLLIGYKDCVLHHVISEINCVS